MITKQILKKLVDDKKIDEKYLNARFVEVEAQEFNGITYLFYIHIYSRDLEPITVIFDQFNFNSFISDIHYNVRVS